MTIFKQLFLMTILGANFGFISADYYYHQQNYDRQQVFNFAAILKYGAVDKQNAEAVQNNIVLADWLISEIKKNTLSELVILVINSHHLTFEQKIEFLKNLKPTTFKKCLTCMSAGFKNTAKFTAALTGIITIPAIITGSVVIGAAMTSEIMRSLR